MYSESPRLLTMGLRLVISIPSNMKVKSAEIQYLSRFNRNYAWNAT